MTAYNPAEIQRLVREGTDALADLDDPDLSWLTANGADLTDQLEAAQVRIAALETGLRTACDHIDDLHLPDPGLRLESIRLRALATPTSDAAAAGSPQPPAPR